MSRAIKDIRLHQKGTVDRTRTSHKEGDMILHKKIQDKREPMQELKDGGRPLSDRGSIGHPPLSPDGY